jgi:hypothetical protein
MWDALMFYVLIAVGLDFATAAMTKEFPQTRTRIAFLSLAAAVIAVTIAVGTGNVGLYYFGSLVVVYGLLMLLARIAAGVRTDRGRFYRDK